MLEHHGCSGSEKPTRRQVTALPVTASAVSADKKTSARALVDQIKTTTGLNVHKRMAFRARDEFIDGLHGDYISEFNMAASLLQVFCDKNPGSHHSSEVDADGRF